MHPFLESKVSAGQRLELAARAAHETNRAYCLALGDTSQPSWESAPEWQKKSAMDGVVHILGKLADGLTPSPSESHDSWLEGKRADGWKYGPVKNPEAKEHPCFVPYEELPLEQRMKDHLFIAVVIAFVEALHRPEPKSESGAAPATG